MESNRRTISGILPAIFIVGLSIASLFPIELLGKSVSPPHSSTLVAHSEEGSKPLCLDSNDRLLAEHGRHELSKTLRISPSPQANWSLPAIARGHLMFRGPSVIWDELSLDTLQARAVRWQI